MKRSSFVHMASSTLVTGTTATQHFLSFELNNKNIGVPVYTFSSTVPDIEILSFFDTDLTIAGGTLYDTASAYTNPPGFALYVNDEVTAWPFYKVDQDPVEFQLQVQTPTLVTNLSATGEFTIINVNDELYGVPNYNFTSIYPSTTIAASAMQSVNVDTVLFRKTRNIGAGVGSTNLNSKIRTYKALIDRILYQLGEPYVNVEVCEDSQMVEFIDKAIEWYTKYAGFTEEYLVFNSELYEEPGLRLDELFSLTPSLRQKLPNNGKLTWDYDLSDYRKVIGLFDFQQGETTGINTLFTLEQALSQQTYFSYMLGSAGFDLVTWEVLKGWLDLRKKVLAQVPYVDFDQRNQLLRIIPAPNRGSRYWGVVGCWVEKPIKDVIMERWVEHYAMALTKIGIGNVRGKYGSVTLFGGGQINYNDLLQQGLEEKKQLEEEIMTSYGEVTPARFMFG